VAVFWSVTPCSLVGEDGWQGVSSYRIIRQNAPRHILDSHSMNTVTDKNYIAQRILFSVSEWFVLKVWR
jgi:hypothetical protein